MEKSTTTSNETRGARLGIALTLAVAVVVGCASTPNRRGDGERLTASTDRRDAKARASTRIQLGNIAGVLGTLRRQVDLLRGTEPRLAEASERVRDLERLEWVTARSNTLADGSQSDGIRETVERIRSDAAELTRFTEARLDRITGRVNQLVDQLSTIADDLRQSPTRDTYVHFRGLEAAYETVRERCPRGREDFPDISAACESLDRSVEQARSAFRAVADTLRSRAWSELPRGQKQKLWRACKDAVKRKLKVPEAADFPPLADIDGTLAVDRKQISWHVVSRVTARHDFGDPGPDPFRCGIQEVNESFIVKTVRIDDRFGN